MRILKNTRERRKNTKKDTVNSSISSNTLGETKHKLFESKLLKKKRKLKYETKYACRGKITEENFTKRNYKHIRDKIELESLLVNKLRTNK